MPHVDEQILEVGPYLHFLIGLKLPLFFAMQKIASVPIGTSTLFEECSALLSFVPEIGLLVPPELMTAMSELALVVVGAVALFHELAT